MWGPWSTRVISDWSRSLQKSGPEGREEIGGDPIHILGKKVLKSHFHWHVASGEVHGQQPQSVRAAGVCVPVDRRP